jgi:hypothetical protein
MLAAAIETNAPAATLKTRDRVDRQLVNLNRNIRKFSQENQTGKAIFADAQGNFAGVAGKTNPPRPHGQCLGIGKTRIIVKIVRLFLFRNLSSERQVKAPKTSVF